MAGTGNDTREKAKEEEKGNQVMNITQREKCTSKQLKNLKEKLTKAEGKEKE